MPFIFAYINFHFNLNQKNMAEIAEKVYCYDRPSDNSNLLATMLATRENKGLSAETLALMNNGGMNGMWNNPFMYFVWMSMFNGGGFGGFGGNNQANEMMNQINSLRQQIGDNQLNSIALDAIKGNQTAISTLANSLNCDINQLNMAVGNVRSAVEQVGGQVGFSAERIINAVGMGDAGITSKLQECCCAMKTAVLEQGYQNQLALERQTNTLGRDIEVFQAQSQLQNCQNTSAVTQAIDRLGFQLQQNKCEIVESNLANTQRILDTINLHRQQDTALALQDEKFKNSQLLQNQYIASLINAQPAARTYSTQTT